MSAKEALIDDIVAKIYSYLYDEDPWTKALEAVRILMGGKAAVLRITRRGARGDDAIFASGPNVSQTQIRDWECRFYREFMPSTPTVGKTLFFKTDEHLPLGDALKQLIEADAASWTMLHCFDSDESSESLLLVARGREGRPFLRSDETILARIGKHFRTAIQLRREILRLRVSSDFQADALDRMAVGAVLIAASGEMLLLNTAARAMAAENDGIRYIRNHIHATDDYEDRELQDIIKDMLADNSHPTQIKALSLSRPSLRRDLGVLILSVRSHSLLSGKPERNVLMFIRDPAVTAEFDTEIIQQLFGFTPAEANIAVGLARGLRLEELEAELNIRHNTARAHLRSMFQKAGVSRQAELVHLLAHCVLPLASGREMH